jgi:septal ring factor EnvC (AmiA/AmiB activator)
VKKYRSAIAIAAAAVAGMLLTAEAPIVGGAILGAAATAIVTLALQLRQADARRTEYTAREAALRASEQRVAADDFRLRIALREQEALRRRYDAGLGTLVSQRERLRLNMEERLVSEMAAVNARHAHELARAKADAFEDGAMAVIYDRLGAPIAPVDTPAVSADVIPLAGRRPAAATPSR